MWELGLKSEYTNIRAAAGDLRGVIRESGVTEIGLSDSSHRGGKGSCPEPRHFALIGRQNFEAGAAVIQMFFRSGDVARDVIEQPTDGRGGFLPADIPFHAE